jgi:hypothetical protein
MALFLLAAIEDGGPAALPLHSPSRGGLARCSGGGGGGDVGAWRPREADASVTETLMGNSRQPPMGT